MEQRLAYLEKANFHKMMALDLSKELGEFNSSINRLKDPDQIFDNCRNRALKIIGFKQISFYLVNEADSSFERYKQYPENSDTSALEKEIDILIEDGTFSRALMEKGPVTAYSKNFEQQLLLHVMATVSRVRGMFVGVLEKKTKHIEEAAFELFSILMAHCANTLESFELYQQLKASNAQLEEKVKALSKSESCLKTEILEHEITEAALEASERQYRLLAETAKEMIFILSGDKKITYANASALKTSEYGKADIMDQPMKVLMPGLDEVIREHHDVEPSVLTTEIQSKTGRSIPLEVSLALIPTETETPRYLLVGRDISRQLAAQEEKQNLEARLWQAQKMESIGLLASGIAHDFNNILSVICNYTALSIAMTRNNEMVSDHLRKVKKASDRAVQLARKLYTIGRRDDHKRVKVNLVDLVKDTLDLVSASLGDRIAVETYFEGSDLAVFAEETRVQQVLMNLITNAGHTLGDLQGTIGIGVARVQVDTSVSLSLMDLRPGHYVRISISDTGPGIEPDILDRIWEPYFSTKTGKDNSGLGLAVVHGIVKNYKGAIDVDTAMGNGTTFHIYLPEYSE